MAFFAGQEQKWKTRVFVSFTLSKDILIQYEYYICFTAHQDNLFWIDFSFQDFNNPSAVHPFIPQKKLSHSFSLLTTHNHFAPFRPSCKLRASTSMHYVLLEIGSMWKKSRGMHVSALWNPYKFLNSSFFGANCVIFFPKFHTYLDIPYERMLMPCLLVLC